MLVVPSTLIVAVPALDVTTTFGFLASVRVNTALKYLVPCDCNCAAVSVPAFFASVSAVESSAPCSAALIELARL